MENEKKTTMNEQPVEAEGKVVEKEKKEKLLVKVGKRLKKVATSKPVKILGRTLVVAGSTLGTVAFLKSGTSKNYEALDTIDLPQFPDTTMAKIPVETETVDPE